MTVTIHVPGFLRRHTGGESDVDAHGATVGDALADVFRTRPDLRVRVVDAHGAVFPYLVVFRNGDEVPRAGLMSAALADGDRLEIVAGAEGG